MGGAATARTGPLGRSLYWACRHSEVSHPTHSPPQGAAFLVYLSLSALTVEGKYISAGFRADTLQSLAAVVVPGLSLMAHLLLDALVQLGLGTFSARVVLTFDYLILEGAGKRSLNI